MANWDKLNNEYFSTVANLTSSQWENWALNRESKKTLRKLELILKAKSQEEKMKLSKLEGQGFEVFCEVVKSSNISTVSSIENQKSNFDPNLIGDNDYAFAA